MLIDPRMTDVERWSAETSSALRQYGSVPNQATENKWRDFAVALRALPVWGPADIPDPSMFDDWRLWAARVFDAACRLGL